jgi:thiamine biosynthesis lipoprotein ApbE
VDGQRVLNPRTGPLLTLRLASATVIDTLAVRADRFDTALMVLGMDVGMALTRENCTALPVHRAHRQVTHRAGHATLRHDHDETLQLWRMEWLF